MVSNTYDDLGRLKTKNLGGVDSTTYTYNVRSWVKDITGSRFTENLYYNNAPGTITPFSPAYNGNIGAIKWNTPADGINRERIYTFGYDDLNRLKDGTYSELAGSTVVNSNRYTEQFDYDKMGNITNFVRYGLQGTAGGMAYGLIDDLTLTHQGNQLIKVTDNGNDGLYYGNEEFLKNTANSGNSAAYDANGNRLYDSNSNVWAIKYNALNLPDAMQFYQGHQTNYTYSAGGAKLKVVDKTAPEGVTLPVSSLNIILSNPSVASTTTTDYDGNYIYENGSLKRILLPEGYWQNGAYCYYLKDHLGSNRVVVRNDGTVVESSSYYPSGMRFGESVVAANNSVQSHRHTGHEMQEMHGLNWIDNNARFRTVSYGGGFTSVDPLAEKYYSISPHAYVGNNPIVRIDKDGKEWGYVVDANGHTTINVALNFSILGNYTTDQIAAYKNAIATQFNNTISEASGGAMSGTITFYEGNKNITQTLALDKMDGSIGGTTSFFNSFVNLVNKTNGLRSLSDVGSDAVHEMLHTLRLEHPFETTQTEDTKLLRVAPNSYVSTPTTDANIVNNVMNYPMTTIDGQKSTNQNSLTKGQLNFMMNEINLQNQGYGFQPKYNPALTPEQNNNLNKQYYENYWLKSPGTPVGNK